MPAGSENRFGSHLPAFKWNYTCFVEAGANAPSPDEIFEMTFAKENAAEQGFNRSTINGVAYPMTREPISVAFHLTQGKRYRLRMRNARDDIHPIHLHRHSFELTKLAGTPFAGILKDVVMLGGNPRLKSILSLTIREPGSSTDTSNYTWTSGS